MPLTERHLIARIRRAAGRGSKLVRTGIGDDCAVLRLPRGHELLVTTDFSLEGIHFRREWHPPDSVGHRCLARGLSDIAAVGGEPMAAFLSLAMPGGLPQRWADSFLDGLLKLARRFRASLAGGDIAQSPAGVLADIVVVGSVARGQAVLRSGARPGDLIYVTGALGASSAGLQRLRAGEKLRPGSAPAHFYPTPRVDIGKELRERRLATAMIDISDGLSTDLGHICEESGVGAVIDARRIPVAPGSTLQLALHGGEDYELLFTARASGPVPGKIEGVAVTPIGQVTRARGMWLVDSGQRRRLATAGWQHFRR